MRVLAVDFGSKRIGLAISDPLGFTAQGLPTLANQGQDKVLGELTKLCKEREVGLIVIGVPLNMKGDAGLKAQEIMKLVPEIEAKTGVPVKTWDERLTSREAGRLMIAEGLSRDRQKQESDRLAATLILQNYLESQRGK